jgi:hypothetical protein
MFTSRVVYWSLFWRYTERCGLLREWCGGPTYLLGLLLVTTTFLVRVAVFLIILGRLVLLLLLLLLLLAALLLLLALPALAGIQLALLLLEFALLLS